MKSVEKNIRNLDGVTLKTQIVNGPRMTEVKDHFEEEAHSYDKIIIKLIPYYKQMIEALVSSLPFDEQEPINVLDLGCGTGTVSAEIKRSFPQAQFTLVDISEKMLQLAQKKVGKESVKAAYNTDFYELDLTDTYHVVASSLALHHLESDEDKKSFYSKIFKFHKSDGVFRNADVVLASNEKTQSMYMEKWIEYMSRECSAEEISEKWIPTYESEDRPAKLSAQLEWLKHIGFEDVDVIWKYYNFAVYGGKGESK